MVNPELTNPRIGMGKREPIGCFVMTEIGGIEVQSHALFFRPIHPALKMLRGNLVALDQTVEFTIAGVQV